MRRRFSALLLMAAFLGILAWPNTQAAAQSAGNPHPEEVHLVFVGDLMVGRTVNYLMTSHGLDAPFREAAPFLQDADLTVGNLEGPIVPLDKYTLPRHNSGTFNLTGNMESARALAGAGFDLLSVSNNHAYDSGQKGLQHTIEALRGAEITPFGLDDGVTQRAVVREVRGVKIAFLAYTELHNSPGTGVGYVRNNTADKARLAQDIARARAEADIVVVYWHWGAEYAVQPGSSQRALAQASADAGADLVVGMHPHVAQGMEVKVKGDRTTLVTYSLGNALFDQDWSLETQQGLALVCRVDKRGVKSGRFLPLYIPRTDTGFTMRIVDDLSGQDQLQRAAKSTPPELQWKVWFTALQKQPGVGIGYYRR